MRIIRFTCPRAPDARTRKSGPKCWTSSRRGSGSKFTPERPRAAVHRTDLRSVARDVPLVCQQMPQRLARPVGFFVQSRQIEVRVAQQRILDERVAIRGHRLVFTPQVFEQRGEVERQDGARGTRLAIQLLRLLELSIEMQQSPEVDPRLQVIFLNAQRREICGT